MAGVFITTTPRGAMRPLASQGIFATDCFSQIRALLEHHLTSEHALLLAEPVHDAHRESVDWYAGEALGGGTAVPLRELPPEEAEAARRRIGALAETIRTTATHLSKDPDAHRALSGQMLDLALKHPGEDDIWVLNGHPIVINWGFAPGVVGAQPQDLTRLAPPPPPVIAVPVVAAAAPPRAGCLPWLLPLLLLLLLLLLLSGALGVLPLPGGCTLFKADDTALANERARAARLREDIDKLRADVLRRAEQCRPPTPVTPPEKAPAPPETLPKKKEPQPEPEVIEPFLGETPATPVPPVAEAPKKELPKAALPKETPPPKEDPKQERPEKERPRPKKNEPLKIPEDAPRKKDMSFLEGCWRSETGLYSSRTGKPIIAEYCFDKHGNGRRLVREQNGDVCNGGVRADFTGDGRLRMDSAEARCPRGSKYVPQRVECTGNESSTTCRGRELGGKNTRWDARFTRK